mgnify:FL=1
MVSQPASPPSSYFDGMQSPITPYGAKLILQRSGIPQQQGQNVTIPYDVVGIYDTSLEHLKMMTIYLSRQLKAYEKDHGKIPVNKEIVERDKVDLKAEWDGVEYGGKAEDLKLLTIIMHRLLKSYEEKNGGIKLSDADMAKFSIDLQKEW